MERILTITIKEFAMYESSADIVHLFRDALSGFKLKFNIQNAMFGDHNVVSIDTTNLNMHETTDVLKRLQEISEENNIVIITAEQKSGVEAIGFDEEILTDELKTFLSSVNSIVKSIKMTCRLCPEQYECFDEYGNQVAYLRLRFGVFRVDCPDCCSTPSTTVYETWEIQGDGDFDNDDERISQLRIAFDAIDNYYNNTIRSIKEVIDENDVHYEKIHSDCTDQEIMETLLAYQRSNFDPYEVQSLRRKGPCIGYHESIMRIIKEHRSTRNNMFPEADRNNGLNDQHIDHEIEFFRTTIDGLGGMVKTINWLFDKSFKDFEIIFRECAKKGSKSL